MSLEKIYEKHGIKIKDKDGNPRHVVDVLEDMYLKLTLAEFAKISFEIGEEELMKDIFDSARQRKYKGE